MSATNVLTNDFEIHFDETTGRLLIYAYEGGRRPDVPIAIKVDTLKDMGVEKGCKWVGETILLLIPTLRKTLFQLAK